MSSPSFPLLRTVFSLSVLALCSTPPMGHAATHTYSRTVSNTSATTDLWSAGTSWSSVPVSGSDTILNFNAGTTALGAGTTLFSQNDIAGNFQLNALNFTYVGPATGTTPTVTLSGNPLAFVNNGGTGPKITMSPTGTSLARLFISNEVQVSTTLELNVTNASSNAALFLSGNVSGLGTITKTGAGIVVFSGTSAFAGDLVVSAGNLNLGTSTAGLGSLGSVLNVNNITLNGGTLAFGNGNGNENRVRDDQAITMSGGGGINLTHFATANTTEKMGVLTSSQGATHITLSSTTSRITTLEMDGLVRQGRSTTLLRGSGLGIAGANSSRILLTDTSGLTFVGAGTTAGSTNLRIIPYLMASSSSSSGGSAFATYDATLGFRQLDAGTEFVQLNATGSNYVADHNTRVTTQTTLGSGSYTVNSLFSTQTDTLPATISFNGAGNTGDTLTITSGALAVVGTRSLTIQGFERVIFGNGEAVIVTGPSLTGTAGTASATIASSIDVTGGGGLTKTGLNTLSLTGDNIYTGQTVVNMGTLRIGNGGRTGSLAAGASIQLNGGNIAFNRTSDSTIDYAISGQGTFIKSGVGTLTQTGSSSFTGQVQVNYGKLVLDYSGAAAGTNTNYVLQSGNSMLLTGGTVEFKAKAGAGNTTVQNLGGVDTVAMSGTNTLTSNLNGGTALTVNLGSVARGSQSILVFDVTNGGTFTSTSVLTAGLFAGSGGFLVKNGDQVDFATKRAGNVIGALGATAVLPGAVNLTDNNYKLDGDYATTGAVTARSLRVNTTGEGQSMTLNQNMILSGAALLFVGQNDYTIKGTGYLANGATNGAIFVENFGAGKLTIDESVKLGNGSGTVSFFGTGLVDWRTVSNHTGTTMISNTVRISNAAAISHDNSTTGGAGRGNITLGDGGIIELAASDMTRGLGSGAGALRFLGSGGFSAFGGDRVVNLVVDLTANPSGSFGWGTSSSFLQDGASLLLGSEYSDSKVDFQNSIDLAGADRIVEVRGGVTNINADGVDGKLSGVISGAGGSLRKTGTGVLELSNNNTYTGGTHVAGGTLLANNTLGSATGTGAVVVGDGVSSATLGGSGRISGNTTIAANSRIQVGSVSGDAVGRALTFGGTLDNQGSVDFDLYSNADAGAAGVINTAEADMLRFDGPDRQITVTGTFNVQSVLGASSFMNGDVFQLIDWAAITYANRAVNVTANILPALAEGWSWDLSGLTGSATSNAGLIVVVAPEPSRALLLTLGLGLALLRRRRR